jgi:FtsP/CotA-like multicopper oxidase with cupredoxin domain
MLNTLRNNTIRAAGLKGAVAALLLAGSAATSAANVTVDLCATAGSTASAAIAPAVPIWAYVSGTCPAAAPGAPGGPVIDVNVGDVVTVNLYNALPEASGLLFQGQALVPDTTGAAQNGGSKSYTFTASTPGTYLYQAAPLPNAEHQVSMGLYGALVIRPTGAGVGTAYGSADTAFDDETVLVLAEIDPALNGAPATFDMRNFAPRYFLINGKVYPDTANPPINTSGGRKLLLRYVNAGAKHHSMGVLGLRQRFIAKDGNVLPTAAVPLTAETLATGQTADALVTIPDVTVASRFAIYDASLNLRNSNAAGFGGMLTFVNAGTGSPVTGPTTSAVTLTPNPANGGAAVTLSAAIASAASTVDLAEYFIDTTGTPGTGAAMTGTATATATLSTATLASLSSGTHAIFVHGHDANGWGSFAAATLNLDKTGPSTTGLTLSPNPSNGTTNLALHGTGNDTATGGANIVAAEYFLGTAPPDTTRGTAMTVNVVAPVASLDASITCSPTPCAAVAINVRSRDAMGNWGPFATIALAVVGTGPTTTVPIVTPGANNGTQPLSASQPVVRITASMTAATGSTVAAAEGFLCTAAGAPCAVGAAGTGFPFVPSDGNFNGATESGFADLPLTTIAALSDGNHTIHVRGKDAAGNWGAVASTILLIDRTAPTFTAITLAPTPTLGATSVALTVSGAADPLTGGLASGVTGGEYWLNPPTTTDPAPGTGTAFSGAAATIPVGSLATGSYTVRVRIRDAAGNWSSGANGIRQATMTVVPDAIFANGFESGTRPWGWSSASTNTAARLNVSVAAALVGAQGLQAQGNNTNYVQYNFATPSQPATATYDARFYFNPRGNTSAAQDIFVARTSGGNTVFRVRYRWNAGTPQVQIQVGTGNTNAAWTALNNNASNRIELVWQAVGSGGPSPGSLALHVNGVAAQSLATTSTSAVGGARLGSVTSGGNATLMYFDGFASKRTASPLIGP